MKSNTKLAEILALTCIPVTDHPGHFDVQSRTEAGGTHRVRLRSEDGIYHCQCPDFLWNVMPRLDKGAEPFQVNTLCIHTARAILFAAARGLRK